jgi:hypothetical protein
MRVRVDPRHVSSLARHLSDQGFPATLVGKGTLDVLFPAAPTAFATAVELDDWRAQNGGVPVRFAIAPDVSR